MEYDVVVVGRLQNQLTGPTLTEVGRINGVNSISWMNQLNRESDAVVAFDPRSQSDAVKARLRDLVANPSELAIYKGSNKLFQGPITVPQVQGTTLVLNAKGLYYYTIYMVLEATETYAAVDQWVIARDLIDAFQDLDYGNYGLDVSAVTTSGVTRNRTYKFEDGHVVYQRIIELAELKNGFDFDVGVNTRALNLYASKGSDLSTSVHLDARGVTDPNAFWSVSQDTIASEAHAIGYSEENEFVFATKRNATLRSSFGRVGVAEAFPGVATQATIDNHAQGMIDARDSQLFKPGPSLFAVTNVGVEDFDTGDTVTYDYDLGLGLQTLVSRVLRKRVRVNAVGQEFMDVEFT